MDYLVSYAFLANSHPISLSMPLDWNPDQVIKGIEVGDQHDRRPPSFIYDLVPQGQGRRLLLRTLNLADVDSIVLPLVAAGAFNPIGALRLSTAVDFYREQVRLNPVKPEFNGVTIEDIANRSSDFLEHISLHAMLATGTTGVQGVAPKYLLTQDADDKWHADLALPDDRARAHWLVKLPRGRSVADLAILRNEAAYLRVAAACGLRAANAPMMLDNMLFIRRFDREVVIPASAQSGGAAVVHRLHQESLASLAGLRGFAPATSQNELLAALRLHSTDPLAQTIEFLKRDVLNLALRNTDNHARNSAIQRTRDGCIQLTPFFDFAPMFMDPEIIARSLHWRARDGVRLDNWCEILDALEMPDADRAHVHKAMGEFADIVVRLPEIAQECGVDAAVLEQCMASIQNQADQLLALGGTSHGRGDGAAPRKEAPRG